jgi:hypothetical protein
MQCGSLDCVFVGVVLWLFNVSQNKLHTCNTADFGTFQSCGFAEFESTTNELQSFQIVNVWKNLKESSEMQCVVTSSF